MTDIGRATTIIHEVVHANLYIGNNIEENVYGGDNKHHYENTKDMVSAIQSTLG